MGDRNQRAHENFLACPPRAPIKREEEAEASIQFMHRSPSRGASRCRGTAGADERAEKFNYLGKISLLLLFMAKNIFHKSQHIIKLIANYNSAGTAYSEDPSGDIAPRIAASERQKRRTATAAKGGKSGKPNSKIHLGGRAAANVCRKTCRGDSQRGAERRQID